MITTYQCARCGATTEDPHTASDDEDVCEKCCDTCAPFEGWTESDFYWEEVNRQHERWKEASLWRDDPEPWTP